MFKQLVSSAKKLALGSAPAPASDLFPKVSPDVDGEDCLHDCESCSIQYPASFQIDEQDALYGQVKGWSTHVLVATGKSDWVRDVADEQGSVMQALERAKKPSNGRLMISASNMPTAHNTTDYSHPATVLLLPSLTLVQNVTPADAPRLITDYIDVALTTTTPGAEPNRPIMPEPRGRMPGYLWHRPSPHRAIILLCSQGTRDARCGQSAPLLRRELERHLRPLGLHRDLDDERPGGVGVYFISHVGGHKYSANMMVYRRPDAFGVDGVRRAEEEEKEGVGLRPRRTGEVGQAAAEGEEYEPDVGATQCIWLARVKPEDIEGIVKYTVLQGKVVKPESQLRGGFDRCKGLMSW